MPTAPAADVAHLLQRFRARSGLTQEALAGATGLSVESIGALECGRRRHPRPGTIEALAGALALSPTESQLFAQAARRPVVGRPCLPAPIADFTGRDAQLDGLVELLRSPYAAAPGVVISAIGGMGGVGKTALAIQAGHRVADEFPDGQLYVNLRGGGEEPLSTADALGALLQALGVPRGGESGDLEVAAARYRSALAGRRVLVLLDDAVSAEQVRLLLPGTPGVAVVITSRQQLSTLPGLRRIALDVLTEVEALRLLGEISGHERVAAEPEAAREVVRRCGYLPLAIRIAGQAARGPKGLARVVELLSAEDGRRELLTGPGAGVGRSVLVSLDQLARDRRDGDAVAAEAFPRLSLFDGDHFPLRAAAEVLGQPSDETEALLERLVDIHLLETPAPQQYRMHDLVRDVGRALARERLTGAALAEFRTRELNCYLAMLWRLDELAGYPDVYGSRGAQPWSAGAEDVTDQAEAVSWLHDELPNQLRLVRMAAAGDRSDQLTAVRMALGMPRIAGALMQHGEAHEAMAAVVDLPLELDPRLDVGRQYQMGFLDGFLSRYETAVRRHLQVLPLARSLNEPVPLAICLIDLGYELGRLDRAAEGLPYAEEGLIVVESNNIDRFEVGANVGVGSLAGRLGDHDRQRSAFDRAIALMPSRSNPGQIAVHHSMIGRSYRDSGDHQASLKILTAALTYARSGGLEAAEADMLRELGHTYIELDDFTKAHETLTEGLAIALRFPAEQREPTLRHHLGRALSGLGRLPEAHAQWHQALTQYQRVADPRADEIQALLNASPPAG
ncbi:helix-turn-helix domain-containing protein [Kribbella sp. CA-293567]|uniref:helix-turn-helix domain-containing protein n=1 Tax=Kribbella sp. CA-293567 TaxID=3002436 RepID=UPI0022DE2FE3|nr:helix-turn-helix domain-containing protein [Kribbella sp. CA-293567]WBQ05846.1 helix-turn-helix domain-containing protein [Kribbella sp. CA-293567]